MIKIWSDEAWDDYLYWQTQDKKSLKRINLLIKDIERSGFDGIGKSEAVVTFLPLLQYEIKLYIAYGN